MSAFTDLLGSILPALVTGGVGLYGISQAQGQNQRQAQAVTNASNRELELYEQSRQDTLKWNAQLLDIALEQQGYDRTERADALRRYLEEQNYGRGQTEQQWGAYEEQVQRQGWLDALTERAYEENRADTLFNTRFLQALQTEQVGRAAEATDISRQTSEENLARALGDYSRQAQYWETTMADPTQTASWLNWSKEAEAAYDASIGQLESDLTKRGIRGGIRTEGLERLGSERAQGVAEALREVIANAEQQRANMQTPLATDPQFHQAGVSGGLGGAQTQVQGLAGALSYSPSSQAPTTQVPTPGSSGVGMGTAGMPSMPQVSIPTSTAPDYGSLGASLGWALQQLLGNWNTGQRGGVGGGG